MAGIYLHIPFCKHKCTYCDFTSFAGRSEYAEAYMACLIKEIEMWGEKLKEKTFDTVYFGGGTPSFIDPNYIYGAMNQVTKCFHLTKDPEVTIEMNPGTVSEKKIETYLRAGILCRKECVRNMLWRWRSPTRRNSSSWMNPPVDWTPWSAVRCWIHWPTI